MVVIGRALFVSVALAITMSRCGDDGPTGPSSEAEIVLTHGFEFVGCPLFSQECNFVARAQNVGPDCAERVRGRSRFYRGNSVEAVETWELEPGRQVQPDEEFNFVVWLRSPPTPPGQLSSGGPCSARERRRGDSTVEQGRSERCRNLCPQ